MVLGRDDPELFIPHSAYARGLARNRLSLIGKPLNLRDQPLKGVIQELPRLWGVSSRVHGRIPDDSFVQFRFQLEADLVSVLRAQLWLYNEWFVALQRWEDFPREDFLTFIDLWVQLRGIPLPYVSERTVSFIANTLGDVVELGFNEDTTYQIAFLRVKVIIIFTDRIRFFRCVRFQSGEKAMIGFEYEKLTLCSNCSRINHHTRFCPFSMASGIIQEQNFNTFLAPPVNPADEDDEHVLSESSDISSYSPISQPPRPPSPMNNEEGTVVMHPIRNLADIKESMGSNSVKVSQPKTGLK
ncbi:PREDICTED: uncharacterized protein At4g02000-like [Camelina sativa]|uniref:Uncharacterized protein At4g02000-like n=1 Tax=Camelina sativa TaxID=90675 RepID=A0ABM1QKP4_CAMSA|nr:PREDICTED: uncharacterized protein At4g02000-like [Camelina sativa]